MKSVFLTVSVLCVYLAVSSAQIPDIHPDIAEDARLTTVSDLYKRV